MSTRITPLTHDELDKALNIRDLSNPAHGVHGIQLVADELLSAVSGAWPAEVRTQRGGPVVALEDNYDHLGYGRDAVTRDARYTRYVDAGHVLRSHSSAMIAPALRSLAAEAATGSAPTDVLLAAPGMCYRRDSVDWQHTGTPHQMDLWRVRSGHRCGPADLEQMIGLVVGAVLPGSSWRAVPAKHPYTVGGRQLDVLLDDQWIEIGECGVAAPAVLERAGLDRHQWSGLAMGVGLDRLLMLRKGVPDIRLLRSHDDRVAAQMLDLAPYRPVSHLPAVRRDLSVAVGSGVDVSAESIGDRVRSALGGDADVAETVEVLSVTRYYDLPVAARDRLGLRPGQRNLLVRLVLRPLDRSLTDADANVIRDLVYAALHEGSVHQWADAG